MVILGVDYGDRRLGFARCDPSGMIAVPLQVVTVHDDEHARAEIERLCREQSAETIVVGLPLAMDGTKGPMALKVEAFVEKLRSSSGLLVEVWDERFTTKIAERALLDADLSRKKRRGLRDKMAAQIMLQGYLDAKGYATES